MSVGTDKPKKLCLWCGARGFQGICDCCHKVENMNGEFSILKDTHFLPSEIFLINWNGNRLLMFTHDYEEWFMIQGANNLEEFNDYLKDTYEVVYKSKDYGEIYQKYKCLRELVE